MNDQRDPAPDSEAVAVDIALGALVDGSRAAVTAWRYDHASRAFVTTSVNQAALDLLGVPSIEAFVAIGGMRGAVATEDWDSWRRELGERNVATVRTRVRRPDGGTRWIQVHSWWLPASLVGWATIQDVTHEVELAARLAEHRETYRRLFNHASAGMFRVDTSGRLLDLNQAAARILGYQDVEHFVASVSDIGDVWLNAEQRDAVYAEVMRSGRASGSVQFQTASGEVRSGRIELSLDRERGVVEGVLVDIEESVRHRAELEELECRYRSMFENSVAGMVGLRISDGRLIAANPVAVQLLGYDSAEQMRQDRSGPEAVSNRIRRTIASLIQTHQDETVTTEVMRDGAGRRLVIQVNLRVMPELDAAYAVVVDVTREHELRSESEGLLEGVRLRTSERRRLAQQALQIAETERRRIASDLHDGPTQQLTAAIMFLETYREAAAAGEGIAQRHRLEEGRRYLREALDEMRSVSTALLPIELADRSLPEALAGLAERLAQAHRIAVHAQVLGRPSQLGDAVETALFRVAQEAATNACKHAGAGSVAVTLDYRTSEEVRLLVRDNGRGFEPARATVETEDVLGGVHLGMTGMSERLQIVGGHLDVESTPGVGTVIRATVPCPPTAAGPLRAIGAAL